MSLEPPEDVEDKPGGRCARELAALVDRYQARRVFVVCGQRSFELSGAEAALEPVLKRCTVVHFRDFSPNPTLEEVERGLALFRDAVPELVVGIGGGTAIDLAKMIGALAGSAESTRDLLTGAVPPPGNALPLVAIPTTAGSGAEVTHFAAVYVDGKKYSLTHESLRPTHSILDATLTRSLPTYLTAATGMDALAQAIESYWSVRSNAQSRVYSAQAIRLCNSSIVTAATETSGKEREAAREAMMQASHLAGKAIDVARTTAPHALSYVLTTDFGVTHGHAVALTLGAVFAFNASMEGAAAPVTASNSLRATMDELCALMQCTGGDTASLHIAALMESCGLKTRLREVGVARSDLPRLAASVNPQRLKNNPRELTPQALGAILESVY
jgi:alcohol dehydrogenase class IV